MAILTIDLAAGERLYTTEEAAALLGISPRTLETARQRGGGPRYYRVGRCVRYAKSDLIAYLAKRLRKSTSDIEEMDDE